MTDSPMSTINHLVIIGNGISGITCAKQVRKLNSAIRITVISGESPYFFSRTALMYVYMGHMKFEHTQPHENWFWEKNRIDLVQAWVERVDFTSKTLFFQDRDSISYDQLVLATGSKPNRFGWPGQDLIGVQGLYSRQDLDLMAKNTSQPVNRAVLVGGGLIGVEMAEMLAYKKIPVTFLVRDDGYWRNVLPVEEANLVTRHLHEHHVDLYLETELEEILPDSNGRVRAVRTKNGEEIPCQFVGLTAGVSPNVDFLKNTELAIHRGILVNSYFETTVPDVFAIGDCAEFKQAPGPHRKTIEQVWYTGRMHGETLAHGLCKQKVAYRPGFWFNSAKFFDIEYQTYGIVPADWDLEEYGNFYWEDSSGKICFRMLTDREDRLVGVNNFGFRLRHSFFDQALRDQWTGVQVIQRLEQANFDPEFFKSHIREIQQAYAKEKNIDLPKRKKSWVQLVLNSK